MRCALIEKNLSGSDVNLLNLTERSFRIGAYRKFGHSANTLERVPVSNTQCEALCSNLSTDIGFPTQTNRREEGKTKELVL